MPMALAVNNLFPRSWFASAPAAAAPAPAAPRVPNGFRVYAVGDIHGRSDLLARLHDKILADMATAPEQYRVLVYLGDYIDRGPDSRGVIDQVLAFRPDGTERVFLKGNHESAMLAALEGNMAQAREWMNYGGLPALQSYGINIKPESLKSPAGLLSLYEQLQRQVPESHRNFLNALLPSFFLGDYLFVHAGVNPQHPLTAQKEEDLLWIRDGFLRCRRYLGKVIVHGHTITSQPDVRDNRIGIDTGAYATGRLTAMVLAGTNRHFLQT